jgi:glycosyltransferase involved in cell wall biosynthesis
MKNSLISCIVPVYNGEQYLKEALDSILTQTYRELELIVIDDGSTDGTAAVVAGYGDRVRCQFQPNAGPAAACNSGLTTAHGDLVAFLAADDLWHPEKLARQMARFQARPELDLCVTQLQNFWVPKLIEEEAKFRDHRLSKPMPGYTCVTLLARRSLFETVGAFNSTLQHGNDLEWFLRAAEHGAVMELLPDVLVYRRLHQTNRSRRLAANSREAFLQILKTSLDRRRRHSEVAPPAYQFPTSERSEPTETD